MPDTRPLLFANNPEGLIVWNGQTQNCLAPQKKHLKKAKGLGGKERFEVEFDGKVLSFLPSMSPLPLNEKMELNENSQYRIFSKKLFENSPHLFVFGKEAAYFDKEAKKWVARRLKSMGKLNFPGWALSSDF